MQCTADPDAAFPYFEPGLVNHGVHGQHDGISHVIHLSRGRCPSYMSSERPMDGVSCLEVRAPHRRRTKDETAVPRTSSRFHEACCNAASIDDLIIAALIVAEGTKVGRGTPYPSWSEGSGHDGTMCK